MGRLRSEIQRARGSGSRLFHDMEVDHGGGDVGVAHKLLHGANIDAVVEKVGRKRVPQGRS